MSKAKIVDRSYAIADPDAPDHVIKPNADGSVNVVGSDITITTVTDFSNTTDGANHTVIPANTARIGYLIENPADITLNANSVSIYLNWGVPATALGGSFEITPGGYFPLPGMPLFKGSIQIIGAAGIKFTAKELT